MLRLGGSTGPQSPRQCASPHLGVLVPAFSSLSHQAGEQVLLHPARREMSSVMGCCPLPRTAPRGRETGLNGHTPGLWMTSQASGGCGVLLHAAVALPLFSPRLRDHVQVTVLPRYWLFWKVGICFFQVVHSHIEQDLTKTVGASWLLAALAGTQLTADDLILVTSPYLSREARTFRGGTGCSRGQRAFSMLFI